MRSAILPLLLAAFFAIFPAVLAHANPKPSSGPTHTGWHCPAQDQKSRSKIDEYCDTPPHKGSIFGCSYHDGHGGNYVCTFDSKTGECTGGGEHCPKNAHYHNGSKNYKRAPQPQPAPVPTPVPVNHRAARHLHRK